MSVLDEAKAALTEWDRHNADGAAEWGTDLIPDSAVIAALRALVVEYETLTTAERWEYGVVWLYNGILIGYRADTLAAAQADVARPRDDDDPLETFVARRHPESPAGPWEVVEDAQ